jgi:hypothetical protein
MPALITRLGRAIAVAWLYVFADVRRDLTASVPDDDDPLAP